MLITPENVTVQDWELRADDPDKAIAASTHVPGADRSSLLFFNLLDVIGPPVCVISADLVFAITAPPGAAGEISVGTILTPWLGGPLSWNVPWSIPGMAQDADYEPPRSVPVVTPDDGSLIQVKVNVVEDVRRWMSGSLPNLGWRVTSSLSYGAARNVIQAAQPTLSVKYSDGAIAAVGAGISTGAL